MKSVEGVDRQSSVRSSSIPPASLSKMSIKKGKTSPKKKKSEMSIHKGKTPPKKNNGSKNRYRATSANNKAVFERISHRKKSTVAG